MLLASTLQAREIFLFSANKHLLGLAYGMIHKDTEALSV